MAFHQPCQHTPQMMTMCTEQNRVYWQWRSITKTVVSRLKLDLAWLAKNKEITGPYCIGTW